MASLSEEATSEELVLQAQRSTDEPVHGEPRFSGSILYASRKEAPTELIEIVTLMPWLAHIQGEALRKGDTLSEEEPTPVEEVAAVGVVEVALVEETTPVAEEGEALGRSLTVLVDRECLR